MMSQSKEPSVGIIMSNKDGKDDTIELIDSLSKIKYTNYKIFICDNNSSDGSQQEFSNRYKNNKKINLIFNKKDFGLAGSLNRGLEKSLKNNMDYSFIMNNDIIVDREFLPLLVDKMEKNKKLAATGPIIFYYDEKNIIWNAGVKFRLQGFKNLEQNDLYSNIYKENNFVDALDCAYLMNNSIVREIGMLYEDFFIMQEMVGWCIKAKKYGYFSSIEPRSKIWHKVARTVEEESYTRSYYSDRNWLILLKRTQPFFVYLTGLLCHLILLTPRFFYYQIIMRKKFLLKARIKGTIASFKFK